jgi:hypothetical protein
MTDDFWNCPFTGGKVVCDPSCVVFIRDGPDGAPYCRKFGLVSKVDQIKVSEAEKRKP